MIITNEGNRGLPLREFIYTFIKALFKRQFINVFLIFHARVPQFFRR